MGLYPGSLPDFPWDSLARFRERAGEHPDGVVDLSVGTPVDPTPELIQRALSDAANAPGYPTTHGTADLRRAVVEWFARTRGVSGLDPDAVLPTVGSKELVAWLPSLLGLSTGDVVVHPAAAYPTYAVGAVLAGASAVATDVVSDWANRDDVRLVWINSPSNPTGSVLSRDELRAIVDAARSIGAVVASDECYAALPWEEPWVSDGVPSVLDPEVCGGDHTGLLAVYSLSKQSSLAGYRAAFVAGDAAIISGLLETRKHAGMIVPGPVQAAMATALRDDQHVTVQREVYRARRAVLRPAVEAAGFTVTGSDAGLYLWASRDEDCWKTIEWLAERGIVAAPGSFYGTAGERHVRMALTATDERVQAGARRL
ncbi:succinyldiaminopimelate transaminase [Demequina muriae]|uniref:Aminotransferase n=1 Tax=Demequina muriae TaxID=3051664 RepID=A0ABT8GEY1_9MICO|nr:succinyldiaminopimelate transaminase [Demequina sp. EGI L300058]MDN4479990.1 succinyldiaminopimelate transaminase [Demequina sp. EGI L300058]